MYQAIFNQLKEPRVILNINNTSFIITAYNDAFKRITGSHDRDLVGRNFLELFASGDIAGRRRTELELALRNVCVQKKAIKLPPTPSGWFKVEADGDARWWEIECAPLHDASDNRELILCTIWEITERIASNKARERTDRIQNMLLGIQEKMNDDLVEATERITHAEADLRTAKAREERLHRMVMGTQAGMFVLGGKELIIMIVNKPVTDLLQKESETLTGVSLLKAFPELSDQPLLQLIRKVQQSGKPASFLDLPVWFHRPDGSVRQQYIDCGITRVEESEGQEAIVISITDTTKVLQAKRQLLHSHKRLQQAEQLLQQAISTADMGAWSIDLKTNALHLSGRLCQIFGVPPDSEATIAKLMNAIDPDYRQLVNSKIEAGLQRHEDVVVEYPLTNLQTGQRLWIKGTGKAFFNPDGEPAHFSGVFIDITKSKEEEERRNSFIAIVSHELKTPLTAAKGFLQLLERHVNSSPKSTQQTLLRKALTQTDRMNRLIDAYLNSSKLESGKIALQLSTFKLNHLIEEIIEDLKLTSHFHHISFVACDPKPVMADKEKIGQVISNFISNAIKYSPRNTEVKVTCDYTDHDAIIRVHDHGIGISTTDQAHIFERFYRVGLVPSLPVGSFGIGLYLCSEIIQRHNGKISVESELGKGSVFSLTIPLIQ